MKRTQKYELPQHDEDNIISSIIDEMHQLYIELCNKLTVMDSDYAYECKVRLHALMQDVGIETHIDGESKLCSITRNNYLDQKCADVFNKHRSIVSRMRANQAENILILDALETLYEFLPEYLPEYDEWMNNLDRDEDSYAA